MARPRIAVLSPTSADLEYNRRCQPQYVAAVEQSGGEAVPFSLTGTPDDLAAQLRRCSGLLLPGSPADVRPDRYGQQVDPATAPADGAREKADLVLLEEARQRGMPVLGVCFGLQSINVWLGGTLVQDLSIMPVNHSAGSAVHVAHTVAVADGSVLASLAAAEREPSVDGLRRAPVNSSHHQAIGIAGTGLRVTARCPQDGVVEAVEAERAEAGQWLVAVQWHPERTFATSATSRALFGELVAQARQNGH